MFSSIARKIFGTVSDRILKSNHRLVEEINALEPVIAALSDSELQGQTEKFRRLLGEGQTLEDILPEAFATVREASKRVLGMRPFDVQLLGGIILHKGMIAEMKTGEGKTLVATLPAYLNAIEGKGVHVVTVNDYLAQRDAAWMGKVHRFLGLSVGCIVHDLSDEERRAAYASDITYGTNNEFGFDYLRDNMRFSLEQMVQRSFNYAIVDEVDSILIDEARTPLIISGPVEDNSELYNKVNVLIPKLSQSDWEKEEKTRTVTLTEDGVQHIERMLVQAGLMEAGGNLYDIGNVTLVHHVNQALRAHTLFTRDVDYIVKDKKIVIIDEFTGRMMEGRRYSEGLHQALEAKEGVPVQNENQTLASITFQNYFRLYPKLAGMTGTALTEAPEFRDIYKLEVVEIPTHNPVARVDEHDEVYRSAREKYEAVLKLIEERHKAGQPMLVGTVSIEKSELLSEMLKKRKIPHQVLNARYHEQEAYIVAQAGRPGAVTIATNMAGRGTDIMLGGNPEMRIAQELKDLPEGDARNEKAKVIRAEVESAKQAVIAAGGLYVVATERHESRRIDNQLRGRSGRQGDPGCSKFFLSLEDDLMRIFGGERMDAVLQRLGMQEGEALFHPWINKALEKAQQKVEARNYEIRKSILKYDDTMNDQRKVIYEQRIELMQAKDVSDVVTEMRESVNQELIQRAMPHGSLPEQWDMETLSKELFRVYGMHMPAGDWAKEEGVSEREIEERIMKSTEAIMIIKEEQCGPELMRMAEKRILLQTLDQLWKDHLLTLDHMRQGINLRAYGQRDPVNEYKQEAFTMFEQMLHALRELVTQRLAHLTFHVEGMEELEELGLPKKMIESRQDPALADEDEVGQMLPLRSHVAPENRDPHDPSTWGKLGRNETCPCGSGKKYKHCHGQLA